MAQYILILNNQLFDYKYYTKIDKKCMYIIYEHPYFFKKFKKTHKLKIAYHRAAMRYYFDHLPVKRKIYVNFNDDFNSVLKQHNLSAGIMFNPIEKDLIKQFKRLKFLNSPYFLNSSAIKMKNIRHDTFYKMQRRKYNILLHNNMPLFGQWSFDKENRMKFPGPIKEEIKIINNQYTKEAIKYVDKYFKTNYGEINFIYPMTRKASLKWLSDFMDNKLRNFGKYEDAMHSEIMFGYHSVLSPMLNIGLITPHDVLKLFRQIKATKHNIATLEGFIRQIIGWREYNYVMYNMLTKKQFYNKNKNKLPNSVWRTKTDIKYIDDILNKVNKYAYCHHIERLMGIGNYLLLRQITAREIFKWFSTMFIDAYEVFMIPNVYGMLLYGYVDKKHHMMTKPYFCSSNYIAKMSNYKKSDIIDKLYYELLDKYKDKFAHIYSTANAVKTLKY